MAIVERKNGVLQDTETGRFVAGGKPVTAIQSPSQARDLANRRYELARDRIRTAVLAEVKSIGDIPADTPEDAYAFVVAKQTVALIDSDKPRFDDVEKLGQLMGTVERKQDKTAETADTIGALADLVHELGQFARALPVADVVDGETTEE